MCRVALWVYYRWAYPRLIGYIARKGSDVYMLAPEQVEVIYRGRGRLIGR